MTDRYPIRAALTSLALISTLGAAAPNPAVCRVDLRLYSHEALRKARTLLLIRLLQARRERADLARAAVTRAAPIAALLAERDVLPSPEQGVRDAHLKHLLQMLATTCR